MNSMLHSTFKRVCRDLNLDEHTSQNGFIMLTSIFEVGIEAEELDRDRIHMSWVACALFFVSYGQKGDGYVPGARVTNLLVATNIPITLFMEQLGILIQKLKLDTKVEDQLRQMRETFISSSLIFRKYQQLWENRAAFTLLSNTPSALEKKHHADLFDYGWLLFILVKSQCPGLQDLASGYYLVLACLHFVVTHAPPPPSMRDESDVISALSSF